MNSPRMFSFATVAGALALCVLPTVPGYGQTTATTGPVGYLQVTCLASSDTLVAIPFARPTAFTGAVASVTGTAGNVISFTAAPGFTAGQFVFNPGGTPAVTDHFYLSVGPAPLSLPGTVSVTQGSPTVTGSGTTFTSLVPGDRMSINDGYNVQTYTVAAVASDTVLMLDRAYADSAVPAATGNSTTNGVKSSATTASAAPSLAKSTPPTATAKTATVATTSTSHRHRGVGSVITPAQVAASVPGPASTGHTTATVASTVLLPATATNTASSSTAASSNTNPLSGLTATYDHSPYEGRWYMVTANDAGTVTVNLNGDTLPASLASAGTQVSIVPCWTFDTLFPAANANVAFTPSASVRQLTTQILLPDYTTADINLSSTAQYYYLSGSDPTNVGWRLYGDDPTINHGTDCLIPDGFFTVRNDNGAPTLPITFNGSVLVNKVATALNANASQPQDNAVGLNRPVAATLNALGLNPTDNSFQASSSPRFLTDQLLVFDNTQAAIDKSSTAQYYYISTGSNVGWRLYGDDPTIDHGTDSIPAASALIVRKGTIAPNTATPVWTNAPNY